MLTNEIPFVFNTKELTELAQGLRNEFISARPFQHVVFDNFIDLDIANKLVDTFPDKDSSVWLDWKKRDTLHQPKKQGICHASLLGDNLYVYLQNIIFAFNSYPFLNFLENLTGIKKLLPDPYLHGGGIHQILSGGKLSIHTDYNYLKQLDLYRRINVLLYLNKDWKPEYRGELELWDQGLTKCMKSIAPLFNRLVVFKTDKKTFHGHPTPLNTPPDITRKSIALYFYTAQPLPDEIYDTKTNWQETTIK